MKMPVSIPIEGRMVELAEDWSCKFFIEDICMQLTVKKGFRWDGASIPAILNPICGESKDAPRCAAALAHDWLYASHVLIKEYADSAYYQLQRQCGIPWWKAALEYVAVSLFGRSAWKSHGAADRKFANGHGALAYAKE